MQQSCYSIAPVHIQPESCSPLGWWGADESTELLVWSKSKEDTHRFEKGREKQLVNFPFSQVTALIIKDYTLSKHVEKNNSNHVFDGWNIEESFRKLILHNTPP